MIFKCSRGGKARDLFNNGSGLRIACAVVAGLLFFKTETEPKIKN